MKELTKELQFDTNIYNTIRKNIRKYRKEKGITSARLAELSLLILLNSKRKNK